MIKRQGDVLIVSCEANDPILDRKLTEIPRDNGKVILAYGEVTNHAHALLEQDIMFYMPEGVSDVRILDVPERGTLVHEEHDAVDLPAGKYKVYIQTEYQPDSLRTVLD